MTTENINGSSENCTSKIYCGVEDSTCNKGLKFFNHSKCCALCEHDCSNCSIKAPTGCEYTFSKKDIALLKINEHKELREKLKSELDIIDNEIKKLEKYL